MNINIYISFRSLNKRRRSRNILRININMHPILLILLIIIVGILLFRLYFRVKYPFWSRQPVFHLHNLMWWIMPPGIISEELPNMDRLIDVDRIRFYPIQKCPSSVLQRAQQFIKNHYLRDSDCHFNPSMKNLLPYFEYHIVPSFISLDLKNSSTSDIAGVMTTRPLFMFDNGSITPLFYVDYLCVNPNNRKSDVATSLIHNHHYHQRRSEPQVYLSLFKREGKLMNLVPFCVYNTYFLCNEQLEKRIAKSNLACTLLVNKTDMFDIVYSDICNSSLTVITPSDENLKHLIGTKNLYLFSFVNAKGVIASFFVRDQTCLYKGKRTAALYASFYKKKLANNVIMPMLYKISCTLSRMGFKYTSFEDVGMNAQWIPELISRYGERSTKSSPTGYYWYNFGQRPKMAKDVMFL